MKRSRLAALALAVILATGVALPTAASAYSPAQPTPARCPVGAEPVSAVTCRLSVIFAGLA